MFMVFDIAKYEQLFADGKLDVKDDIDEIYISMDVEIRALKAAYKDAKKAKDQDARLTNQMEAARLEAFRNKLAASVGYDPKAEAAAKPARKPKAAKAE
jgi:hypothetical protein